VQINSFIFIKDDLVCRLYFTGVEKGAKFEQLGSPVDLFQTLHVRVTPNFGLWKLAMNFEPLGRELL